MDPASNEASKPIRRFARERFGVEVLLAQGFIANANDYESAYGILWIDVVRQRRSDRYFRQAC
jgi:hypothetical protein